MLRDRIHHLVNDLFDLHDSVLACWRPPETRRHFRAARREALLGLRAVLDNAVTRLEKQEAEDSFIRVPVD
jgi:hypothetical protein